MSGTRDQSRVELVDRPSRFERSAGTRQADGSEPAYLPADRPRRGAAGHRAGRTTIDLDADLLGPLRELGHAAGTTLHVTLLAALGIVISRWTGRDDVCFGCGSESMPEGVRGRPARGGGNVASVCASVAGDPTFRELVSRFAADGLDSARRLEPEGRPTPPIVVRSIGRAEPEGTPRRSASDGGLGADVSAGVDLELRLRPAGDAIAAEAVYPADLFDATTIDRFLGHWRMVLQGAGAAPEGRIGRLPMLTPDEERRLLVEWNDTAAEYPRHLPLARLFEAVVDRSPASTALVSDGESTTYRSLDHRANRLAHHLISLGAGPGTFVGVALPRSAGFVVAVLAILKTGAAYVPFGPEYPAERRRAMARDAGVRLVVVGASTAADWLDGEIVRVDPEGDAVGIGTRSTSRPEVPQDAAAPAYVMYTSGSTGQPKGVVIPHRGVARLVLGTTFIPWGPDQRFLLLAPTAFDASTLELWGPLLHGATLVVRTSQDFDPRDLGRLLERERVTCLWLTAALFNQIIDDAPSILAPVRHLLTGGEPLSPRHVRRALESLPGTRIVNGYGPTETTTFATTHEFQRERPPAIDRPVPIGRPIANTRCLVLDADLRPVPVGVAGELFVGGDGVGLGYLGDAERTAARFVILPFGTDPRGRWYRTGDRVRWRADGELEFLGRTDRQVKIRGFRIEPGEVEAALARHPAVQDVVVVAREDAPGERRLVAYVVAKPSLAAPVQTEIREFLGSTLPSHMIPSASVSLSSLPLTPNGKVDRGALPRPADAPASGALPAPRTAMESRLAAIWSAVLGDREVGIDDDFFDLGGHSLLAARVITRIQDDLGIDVTTRALFERPRLRDLASHLEHWRSASAPPTIERLGDGVPKRMSHEQRALVLRSRIDPRPAVHNMHQAMRLRGPLNEPALRAALLRLLDRQRCLRQCFPGDGGPAEVAIHPVQDPLTCLDLRGIPEPDRHARLMERSREQARAPFDLGSDLLLRLQLVRMSDDDHVLLETLHHALGDGVSMAVFEEEWLALYAAECGREPPSLVPLPFDYTDYAAWQHAELRGERLDALRDFWSAHLEDAPVSTGIPTDRPRADLQEGRGERLSWELSPELLSSLRQVAVGHRVTPFVVLFATFDVLLHRFSGRRDLCVGVPVSHRGIPGTQQLIGTFVNILPLRTRLVPGEGFGDLVRKVRAATVDVQAHAMLPFVEIVDVLRVTPWQSHNPLFQVLFNLVDIPGPARGGLAERAGLHVERWDAESPDGERDMSNVDIVVTLEPLADGALRIRWDYDTALYERSTIDFLARSYQGLLEQVVLEPDTPVDRLHLADVPASSFPLTSPQRGIWIDQAIHEGVPLYNIGGALRLYGPLDVGMFREAVRLLVRKHDNLRLRLTMARDAEGIPLQIILPSLEVEVPLQDFSTADDPRGAADAWMRRRFAEPFPLTQAPLFRFDLVRVADAEHVWLAQYHHLVNDGYGIALLERSLAGIYSALRLGHAPDLVSPSYREFIEDDRRYLESEDHARDRDYWKLQFPSAPEPLLEPGPPVAGDAGSECHSVRVSREFHERLEGFARQCGASVFQVVSAALGAYLGRIRARDEIVIGVPALNRGRGAARATAGLFAGVVPLRVGLAPQDSFTSLLDVVKRALFAARPMQVFPVDEINRLVSPRSSHGQLYDVGISWETHGHGDMFDGLSDRSEPLHHGFEQVPLMLYVRDDLRGEDVPWDLVTRRDHFSAEETRHLQKRLLHLLEAVMADPECRIGDLPLLTPEERRRVVEDWNDTAMALPSEPCVHALLAERAALSPAAVAVESAGRALAYGELDRRAGRLARHLRSLGVGPGTLVGLCVERSVEMVVAMLGILKAGGAYVPLDGAMPTARLARILENAAPTVVLSQRSLAGILPDGPALVVLVDDVAWEAEGPGLSEAVAGDSPAYLMYTSGSTGEPKGVEIPHRALANCLLHFSRCLEVAPRDVWLATTTVSFDISGLEIWLPLLCGARLVVAPRDTLLDPGDLADALEAHDATILQATPVTWQGLVQAGWRGKANLRILCGGEAMPEDLARRLPALGARAWNLYGPTETTIWSTAQELATGGAVGIGSPIANTSVYVLDGNGQPVPPGVTGELFIGGAGVARGYWGRPDLTAERFVPDPFAARPDARLYRTGDLARHRPDGTLECLGRTDHQVKIRGFRIELGEIEAAIARHPAIRDAVVVAREDVPGDKRLVAYVVAKPSIAPPAHADLRDFLRPELPAHMIPAALVVLPSLPLTPNGKIDRRALPRPDADVAGTAGQQRPRSALEWRLSRIWEALFERSPIGRDDHFFIDLGGHSLLATRLAAQVELLVGRRVPIASLFQAPTIASLADLLHREDWAPEWSSLVPLRPEGAGAPLFFLHGWSGDAYAYLDVARELGIDRPIYGVQAVWIDGRSPRHTSVEAMASHYAREILAFQPRGPYLLAGYCIGGWIAYATAQELRRLSAGDMWLGLIDTHATTLLPWHVQARVLVPYLLDRVAVHRGRWRSLPWARRAEYAAGRLRSLGYHARRILGAAHAGMPPAVVGRPREAPPDQDPANGFYALAASRYRPGPYRGDVHIVTIEGVSESLHGFWSSLVQGRVHRHRIHGGHNAIISDPADRSGLVAALRDALADAPGPADG